MMKLLNIRMHLHKNVSFPLIEAHSVFSLFISMRIRHHHHHCSTWSAGSLFFMRFTIQTLLNIDSLSLVPYQALKCAQSTHTSFVLRHRRFSVTVLMSMCMKYCRCSNWRTSCALYAVN